MSSDFEYIINMCQRNESLLGLDYNIYNSDGEKKFRLLLKDLNDEQLQQIIFKPNFTKEIEMRRREKKKEKADKKFPKNKRKNGLIAANKQQTTSNNSGERRLSNKNNGKEVNQTTSMEQSKSLVKWAQ